jgi:hypothetical protein
MSLAGDLAQGEILGSGNLLAFLAWVAARPRTYAETMEAWRTSCPRLSAWEDALSNDLVSVAGAEARSQAAARVQLTERGRALLDTAR